MKTTLEYDFSRSFLDQLNELNIKHVKSTGKAISKIFLGRIQENLMKTDHGVKENDKYTDIHDTLPMYYVDIEITSEQNLMEAT